METVYLKTLVVAAKTGSFSKAATELCITQSAVSQRIKFLEDRYGHQLLDRSGPILVATNVGELVLEKAERILQLEAELHKEIRQFSAKPRLSICCTPTFGIVYLPKVLNKFILHNDDAAELKFMFYTPEQAVKGLRENEFDIGIIEHCESTDLSEFTTHALPEDELIFISSPALHLPSPEIDIGLLLQQRLIARKEGCSSRKMLELNLAGQGHTLGDFSRMIVYDDLRLSIETVVNGGGVSFVSRNLVQEQLGNGSLRDHRVNAFCHTRLRTVTLNKKRNLDTTLESFMDCVFSTFKPAPSIITEQSLMQCTLT